MGDNTVLICFEDQEKGLAEEIKICIEGIFNDGNNKNVNVELCSNPYNMADNSTFKDQLDKVFKSEKLLILVLCSPFSIRQPWINFISGFATLKIESDKENSDNNPAIIIPICHSGQKSNELPHYLLSRQAMEVEHDLFPKKLALRLNAKLDIFSREDFEPENHETKYDRFISPDFRQDEFNVNSFSVKKLCEVISNEKINSLALTSAPDTIEWLNQLLSFEPKGELALFKIVTDAKKNERKPSEVLVRINKRHPKSKDINDLKRSNRRLLEEFYFDECPKSYRYKLDNFLDLSVSEKKDEISGTITSKKSEYTLFNLKKDGESIRIESSSTNNRDHINDTYWLNKIEEMNNFLIGSVDKCLDVGLAIGIQNCLFDEENIYIGLRMKADGNNNFLSSANGEFDAGYTILHSVDELNSTDFEYNFNFFVPNSDQKFELVKKEGCRGLLNMMSEKLKTFYAKPWCIKFPNGNQYIATIFVNNSRSCPRFEIGIWKYIEISKIDEKNKFIKDNFGKDKGPGYWIWIKNGKICYWSFSEEKLIPRFISPDPSQVAGLGQSVLVSTEHLNNIYGRLEKYTPFVSDEDLKITDMVKSRFSVSARALLSCF